MYRALMPATRPEQLTHALHRFGLARDHMTAALTRALGVAHTDLAALEHLEADGPLIQRDLGQRVSLTSGGVTVLVDRLVRAGWVSRRPHPTDRRSTLLELTEAAAKASPEPLTAYHAALTRAARRLDPHARAALVDFLQTAAAHATATAQQLTTTPQRSGQATRAAARRLPSQPPADRA
jgi:DNA-binding MarR family transcriptional regulator